MEKAAWIMDVKHFAVHDGDGIRTTVFFKGCPLRCKWCHNPEGLTAEPTLSYVEKNCISCGECQNVCPEGAHRLSEETHYFDRKKCVGCGQCAEVCLGDALRLYGKKMTVQELLPELLKDRMLYEKSGGGVTLSGGECLMQWEFCLDLLKALKEENIHTAVDTCGYIKRGILDEITPYTDVFLYDIKAFREDVHQASTGVSNRLILENLKYLDSVGAELEVRIPYIPDYNTDEIESIGKLLSGIRHLKKLRLLPFHNLAVSKYASLGIECHMPETLPTKEAIARARECLLSYQLPLYD